MKALSHILGFFAVTLIALSLGRVAKADGIPPADPGMDVGDPLCVSEICPGPVGAGQGFQFTSGANGGGIFVGTNKSGGTWSSLVVTFDPSSVVGTITCSSGAAAGAGTPYDSCTVTRIDPTLEEISYQECLGDACGNGIFSGDTFTVTLNDIIAGVVQPTGGWPPGLLFRALPNGTPTADFATLQNTAPAPVPEPASITLLGVGLGALLTRRKFWSRS